VVGWYKWIKQGDYIKKIQEGGYHDLVKLFVRILMDRQNVDVSRDQSHCLANPKPSM